MSRKLRADVPISREQRKPQVPDTETLRTREEKLKANQKRNFDRHYGVREVITPAKHWRFNMDA